MSLYANWLLAKARETEAISHRRLLEDEMNEQLRIASDLDGTETFEVEGYKVKVTGRLNRKVDADKLQTLAAENGLSGHLQSLFRWKPEINLTIWKQTNEAITAPLLGAITTKPGRPTFDITKEREE